MESIAQARRRDPAGFPDWTYPVAIAAMTIESLAVDIKAQTVPVLRVDIAAQSLMALSVNIVACAATLNVNILSQSVAVNVKTAVGEHVDTDIVSSVTLPINIVAQTITTLGVDIKAQSIGNLNVNIAASAVTLNVNIASSAVTLNVSIQSSAVTLNVKTAAGEHVDSDIVSSITLPINIVAQSIATLGVDIKAQSVGNINVNIAAQAANVAIDFKAQSVSVKLVPDWGAINATDIDAVGTASASSGMLTPILYYTVPAGKTLLVYDWSACLFSAVGDIIGYLYNTTDGVALSVGGGGRGFQASFSKPKRVTAGKQIAIYCRQDTGASQYIYAHLGGTLI